MSNRIATYYYVLIGALGGLIGWFAAGWALDVMSAAHMPLLARTLVKGLIIGAAIGGFVCSRERSMLVNLSKGVSDGLVGAMIGGLAGLLSQFFGFMMFNMFGQNMMGRIIGFVCFGALIGAGEGLKWKSGQRAGRGAAGGAAGGLIAAIVYQFAASHISSTIGDALGNVTQGALVGGGISTACILGHMAILRVVDAPKGKLVGQLLPLGSIGDRDVIGSDGNVSIPIITDSDNLAPAHAELLLRNREYFIAPLTGDQFRPGIVTLNHQRIQGETRLQNGAVIEVGKTVFEFYYLADAKVERASDGRFQPQSQADKADVLYR